MELYKQQYKKLSRLIPNLEEHLVKGTESGKSIAAGFMDLHFDNLGKDKTGAHQIALAHYFEQNGDLVPDPDMQVRVNTEMKTAEALTFQNMYVYQQVYEEEQGKHYVNIKLKKDLNAFLDNWLSNAIAQGHRIDMPTKAIEHDQLAEVRKDELNEARKKYPDEKERTIEP